MKKLKVRIRDLIMRCILIGKHLVIRLRRTSNKGSKLKCLSDSSRCKVRRSQLLRYPNLTFLISSLSQSQKYRKTFWTSLKPLLNQRSRLKCLRRDKSYLTRFSANLRVRWRRKTNCSETSQRAPNQAHLTRSLTLTMIGQMTKTCF